MDSRIQMEFLDRFTIMTKLDFCFGICTLILDILEKDERDKFKKVKIEWEKAIRERFELGIKTIQEYETVTEDDIKNLNLFLDATLKEMNLK